MNGAGSHVVGGRPGTRAPRPAKSQSCELLDLYLDRIAAARRRRQLGGHPRTERARDRSGACRRRAAARGDDVGPLHGLPITIKDAIETEGIRSTGGAIELTDHVPTVDAPAVARLRDAGRHRVRQDQPPALVGRHPDLQRDVRYHQQPVELASTPREGRRVERRPRWRAASPASSSAPTSAVRCAMPSHWCGVYGLKPSYGLVPNAATSTTSAAGSTEPRHQRLRSDRAIGRRPRPAPRRARRPRARRAVAWRVQPPEPSFGDLASCRVGLWLDDAACPISREYAAILPGMADRLDDAGAQVSDSRPPVELRRAGRSVHAAHRARGVAERARRRRRRVRRIAPSRGCAQEDRARSARRLGRVVRALRRVALPGEPRCRDPSRSGRHLHRSHRRDRRRDAIPRRDRQLAGAHRRDRPPSCVPPIGRTRAGLPVGVQIVAPIPPQTGMPYGARDCSPDIVGGYEIPPGF